MPVTDAVPPGHNRATRTAPIGDADFLELMSRFPTGVSVVTTAGETGVPLGLTCSSLASVCRRPPTLLVCLCTQRATWAAVHDSGRFAVNLLHDEATAAAVAFAGGVQDRFAAVRWQRSASGLPWLVEDAFAVAECDVAGSAEYGDHAAVFGEVTAVEVRPGVPLLYGQRQFRSWGSAARNRDRARTLITVPD